MSIWANFSRDYAQLEEYHDVHVYANLGKYVSDHADIGKLVNLR